MKCLEMGRRTTGGVEIISRLYLLLTGPWYTSGSSRSVIMVPVNPEQATNSTSTRLVTLGEYTTVNGLVSPSSDPRFPLGESG